MSALRPLIAVVGGARPGTETATLARRLGEALVDAGYRIATGGLGGVMEEVSRGARRSRLWTGGEVLGVLPGWSAEERPNPWVDVPLTTGFGRARNNILVRAADAVVGVGGGSGTLSEMALAWQDGRPLFTLGAEGWSGQLAGVSLDDRRGDTILGFDDPEFVVAGLNRLFPTGCFSSRGPADWYHGEVPCIHRLHESPPPPSTAQGLQQRLGFSLSLTEARTRLDALRDQLRDASKVAGRPLRGLVTFDDGYRDTLLLRSWFAENPTVQPVLFLAAEHLTGLDAPVPWFDRLYAVVARRVEEGGPVEEALRLVKGAAVARLRDLPEPEAIVAVERLAADLGVSVPLDRSVYLASEELEDLRTDGWFVASHGIRHQDLCRLDDTALEDELFEAFETHHAAGGVPWLSYPDGRWDERVQAAARRAGFTLLFGIDNGLRTDTPGHVTRTLWLSDGHQTRPAG